MILLVLRLLAVYFATCAVCLLLARRFVTRVRPAIAVLLSIGPFLLTGRAMVTAGVYAPIDITYQAPPLAGRREALGIGETLSPILGDVVYQEIPWRKAVREAVKNGRLPLWNRFQLAGEPLLAVQQPAVLHPGTWIGYLLPLAQAWTFEMSLRHFLALLAMYLLLRDLGCREIPSLLGAAGWAFSDYLVFFAGYPLAPAAAPFPLLLLGLRRLVVDPGRDAVGITVAALLLNVTSGHPETLLHAVAGGGVWFLFELARAGRGRRARPLRLSLVAGAVTLGLSAVLLLPLAEALPHTAEHMLRNAWYAHADKSVSPAESLRRSIADVVPYAFGISGKGRTAIGFGEPAAYVGAVLLPFAAAGLFSRRRETWPLLVLTFVGLAMWAKLPVVTDFISGLPLFDIGLNERLVFLGAFGISALAGLGAQRAVEEKRLRALAIAVLLAIPGVWWLHQSVRPTLLRLDVPPDFLRERSLAQLVPLVLLAGALAVARSARRAGAVPVAALLLLLVERRIEAGSVYPTIPHRAFYPALPVLDPIPRSEPWRFTAIGFQLIPNASALYEVEDVRGYEAMTFLPLTETFPLWCVPQPIWFNRVDDPTRPFLSFLNVRWVLVPSDAGAPAGWRTVAAGDGTRLLENPTALPRVFVPRTVFVDPDADRRRAELATVLDFAERGVVDRAGAGRAGGRWAVNGPADVRIAGYRPERIDLDVTAREAAIVGTSIPRWPGWKLDVDGRRVPIVEYNRAFVGFEVPAGARRAVLRYLPGSFLAGSAVTAATAGGCLMAWLLRRRRSAGARPERGAP